MGWLSRRNECAPSTEFTLSEAKVLRTGLSLARRRVRQELLEITASDLAFTAEETEALFSQIYHLPLDKAALSRLVEKSQGWAAGLVLLRDALRKVPIEERVILLDRLALTEGVYEYLADEVWREQPHRVQQFLLATAVLDPVTPPAAAVSGKALMSASATSIMGSASSAHSFAQPPVSG